MIQKHVISSIYIFLICDVIKKLEQAVISLCGRRITDNTIPIKDVVIVRLFIKGKGLQ